MYRSVTIYILFIIALLIIFGIYWAARMIYACYFKNKFDIEAMKGKFMKSVTFKGIAIAILTLALLIPGTLIQNLITEREHRSLETVRKINGKWGAAQTLGAPLLTIPYTVAKFDNDKKPYYEEHTLNITPEELKIEARLTPEVRHYGIYKAILYKSEISFEGNFPSLADLRIDVGENHHFDAAQIAIGVTDLKGVAKNPDLKVNGKQLGTTVGKTKYYSVGRTLVADLKGINLADGLRFECSMRLNGSGSIGFIPLGRHTEVTVDGQWPSPSFIGGFSPESTIDKEKFSAVWNVLNFNREIPDRWSDDYAIAGGLISSSFGVSLIETVDRYQLNVRCAKYALMFIALTFIVFFFVEILTKKTIRFFQYTLAGAALILFYSLLLSLSEQINFGLAYLTAGAAAILMIVVYFYSLIKQPLPTIVLAGVMVMLYAFLYVILQMEDSSLLFGSIFLFVILGVIMFVSNKIKLGKADDGGVKAGE